MARPGSPAFLDLNGKRYLVHASPRSIQTVYLSNVKRRREIHTALGTGEAERDDILESTQDDWSGGEGQIDRDFRPDRQDRSLRRYNRSTFAVDIRKAGEISLGLDLAEDLNIGATTSTGVHMISAGRPVVGYDSSWNRRDGGTWGTAALSGAGALRGRLEAVNNRVFFGSETAVYRVNANNVPASGTQWQASEGHSPCAADGRLYTTDTTANEKTVLRYVEMQPSSSAPFTPTDAGTTPGYDNSVDLVADGKYVYVLVSADKSRPYLYRWNGTALVEFAKLPPAFFIQFANRETLCVLNGILFIAGYFKDPFGNVDDPVLLAVSKRGNVTTIGRIRERGNDEQGMTLFPTMDNQVLIGTTDGNVYAYNMNSGGFYQYASGIESGYNITSICYDSGQFFFAGRETGGNAKVFSTLLSGAGKYPVASKVIGSWDNYGLPLEQKVAYELVTSSTIPSNTSVEFSFETDDGTEYTTDYNNTTMTASATGITTFLVHEQGTTERTFRKARVNFTLKSTDGTNRPIVHFWSLRAFTTTKTKLFRIRLDLSEQRASHHPGSRALTGSKAIAELRALAESSTNRVIAYVPYVEADNAPHAADVNTSYKVTIDELEIDHVAPEEATVSLRVWS